MQKKKKKAEQLTAQAKTEAQIFPEPREESTESNAGPKTDGPGQTSPPKKRKGQLEKEISKADRRIKDRTCEAHWNPVEAGNPKEKRRGGQSKTQKRSIRKGTNTPRPNRSKRKEREEKKNKNKNKNKNNKN